MVKRDLIRNILILVFGLALLISLRLFIFTPYRIHQKDVNKFLAKNDSVLAMRNEEIKREDFVLYKIDGKEYVGRVIARGDDTAVYMDDILYLNGKNKEESYLADLKNSYLSSLASSGYYTHDFSIKDLKHARSDKIPADHYLILNDDRQNLKDSRTFGLISKTQIEGVLKFRLLPLKKFGFIKTK